MTTQPQEWAPYRVGDLIEVDAARLPNPPYLRARITSVQRCDDGMFIVRTDDGGLQRFFHSELVTTAYCPQCNREQRISEPYAFRGMDRLRSTLACGHLVARR